MRNKLLLTISKKLTWKANKELAAIKNILSKKFAGESFLYNVIIDDTPFKFYDLLLSMAIPSIVSEIGDGFYDFSNIKFQTGDCVIDIGGNVGIISIYLAKKYPFLKIYAFEPVKENYENFRRNIKLNKIPDGVITLENKAITGDGRIVNLFVEPENSGGSYVLPPHSVNAAAIMSTNVKSITLEDIFHKYKIAKCKLLKIDCEGSEYEILTGQEQLLKKCAHLRGEFHENSYLHKTIKQAKELLRYCKKFIEDVDIVLYKQEV